MENRIKNLISLYQELNPDMKVTKTTKINNATIQAICNSSTGGYDRMVTWCNKKLSEKEEELAKEAIILQFKDELNKCFSLFQERNEKYGDSWKVLTVPAVANLIEMKMHRIANLPEGAPKTEDEFMDTVNYAIFGLLKLKK